MGEGEKGEGREVRGEGDNWSPLVNFSTSYQHVTIIQNTISFFLFSNATRRQTEMGMVASIQRVGQENEEADGRGETFSLLFCCLLPIR